MRGIGAGQKIHIVIIPEVQKIIEREFQHSLSPRPQSDADALATSEPAAGSSGDSVLNDVIAWLIVNSLRSEQTQWIMLCQHQIGSLYRKNALYSILQKTNFFVNGAKKAAPSAPSALSAVPAAAASAAAGETEASVSSSTSDGDAFISSLDAEDSLAVG